MSLSAERRLQSLESLQMKTVYLEVIAPVATSYYQ
jgi:hypothetical protein